MKKVGTLFLSAVLLAVFVSTAYAVPERMTTYMLQTIQTEERYVFTIGEDTVPGNAVRQSIYDAVDIQRIAPIDWWELDIFGTPVKSAAQALTRSDVETMTLCSFVSIDVSGYDAEAFDEEQAVFHFTNTYALDLDFVAVTGALKDGMTERLANGEIIAPIDQYDWQALRAEPVNPDVTANTDDGIRVYFTKEALTMVNDKDAVVALLCEVKLGTYEERVVTPGIPSKTTDDISTIKIIYQEGENYILKIIPHTELAQTEFDLIYEHIVTNDKHVIDYFDSDVQHEIATLLSDELDLRLLEMNEYATCICYNYDYEHGNVIAMASFPTNFAASEQAVAMIGVFRDDGSVIWTPQKAMIVNGSILIIFTQNILTRMENQPCVLMVLNEAFK